MRRFLLAACLFLTAFSGCLGLFDEGKATCSEDYTARGFDGANWPDLSDCAPVRILSHSAFAAFPEALQRFQNLTGGDAVLVERGDTGSALAVALREKGAPQQDLIYGLDNAYLALAVDAGVVEPYTPLLAHHVQSEALFFPADAPWPGTPSDQGYVGINWDPDGPGMDGITITSLEDVRDHADLFVTQDPNTSSPGLGFLLITIAHYGETGEYTWKDYWNDLFENGVLVTPGWTEAYEQHFSGGYGAAYGGLADRAIVTSYSESPAVEYFFGTPEEDLSEALVAPGTTWHQVQTTALLAGAENRAAAQAWIEFTLTPAYQSLAMANGVYPVTDAVDANDAYGDVDPEPGTFTPIDLEYEDVAPRLTDWLDQWTQICEDHDACG